jgi:hypothetical protein
MVEPPHSVAAQVPGGARLLAVGALSSAILAAIWLGQVGGSGIPLYGIFALLAALPLLARRAASFRKVCLTVAGLLLGLGTVGFLLGFDGFWPTAALLLLAATTSRKSLGSRRYWFIAGVVAALGICAGWSAAIYQSLLKPPDAFVVTYPSATGTTTGTTSFAYRGDSDLGPGVTEISEGSGQWTVYYREGLSKSQRGELRMRLQQIPGVQSVNLCSRWRREC